MLQITADLSSLTEIQREALANFILTFPQSTPELDDDDICRVNPFVITEYDEKNDLTPEQVLAEGRVA